jgi:NAD(P)-dependent dehydrogenase (short-subunit alcohol dehydrogenase family)
MSELTGRVAIVTGASKGIGAAIAKGLAAVGASVVVNYASSREGADRVVAEIAGKGGKAIAVKADVSKAAAAVIADPRARAPTVTGRLRAGRGGSQEMTWFED